MHKLCLQHPLYASVLEKLLRSDAGEQVEEGEASIRALSPQPPPRALVLTQLWASLGPACLLGALGVLPTLTSHMQLTGGAGQCLCPHPLPLPFASVSMWTTHGGHGRGVLWTVQSPGDKGTMGLRTQSL